MRASVLDPLGWADVIGWLSDEENVERLFRDWRTEEAQGEHSVGSRVEAVQAQISTLREKMSRLAETIADTQDRESRHVLQEKLDTYAAQVRREEAKREKLLGEARTAAERAQAQADFTVWARQVVEAAPTFTQVERRDVLRALGATLTLWREDYVHPNGWPQRYQIILTFTGFTSGATPVLLPASTARTVTQVPRNSGMETAARSVLVTPT